jgi:hypothetical protein
MNLTRRPPRSGVDYYRNPRAGTVKTRMMTFWSIARWPQPKSLSAMNDE